MKTLRLLVTKDCNRSCDGCCNKQFDLHNLGVINNPNYYNQFNQIIITGGEPLLFPSETLRLVSNLKQLTNADIILYTAKIDDFSIITKILDHIDGITITLHNQRDTILFHQLDAHMFELERMYGKNKSLRLNVFKGIEYYTSPLWQVKNNIEWIEDCPLPENEVFMRIEHLFKISKPKFLNY